GKCGLLFAFETRRRAVAPILFHSPPPASLRNFRRAVSPLQYGGLFDLLGIFDPSQKCHTDFRLMIRERRDPYQPLRCTGVPPASDLAIRQHLPASTNLDFAWCIRSFWLPKKAAVARPRWRLAWHSPRCRPDRMSA